MKKTKVYFERNFSADCVDVYVIERNIETDKRFIGKPLEMEELEEGAYARPTFRVDAPDMQSLMDGLWNAGLRPSEVPTEGTLAAKDNHIRDLRTIAYKLLKIESASK